MSLQLIQSGAAVRRDRLIRRPEVEALTGCKKSTIYKLMSEGDFPKPVTLSQKHVAWSESAVLTWVQEKIHSITAAKPSPALVQALNAIIEKHSDGEDIAAGLEAAIANDAPHLSSYYVTEAAIHIRSLDQALRELAAIFQKSQGGAA